MGRLPSGRSSVTSKSDLESKCILHVHAEEKLTELLTAAALIGAWFGIQWWLLPRLGVPT